jgi:outer membrane receptor protein involved in Fe transport
MNPKRPRCFTALAFRRCALVSVSLLTFVTSLDSAFAQLAPPGTPPAVNGSANDDILKLSEFVVTGGVTPRSRFDSPVAITTIDRTTIDAVAPRNTAEFLKVMPGVYAESTGGEAFNNISVRGIGGTVGYSYEHIYEDGLPVFSTNNLRHGLPDAWSRLSTFISNVEAVRSGSSSVLASNAPLAVFNYLSREGGSVLEGEAAFTTSDYGTFRTDVWLSGPLGRNTTFAIGGWYRVDDGVRDAGFVANKGGEIRGNVKHSFANGRGYLKGSFKVLNDHNSFDLPMPLTGGGSPRSLPFGPDWKKDPTSNSSDTRILSISGTPIGQVNYDLADGITVDLQYIGTELEYTLTEGIKVQNRNRYSDGFRSIDYMFNSLPFPWQTVANNAANRDAAQFAAGLSGGSYRFRLTYPGQGGAVAAANPAAAAALGNGLAITKSWQHSDGDVSDFQNDLRLLGTFNEGNTTVTGGIYYSFLQTEQHYLFNTLLTDVSPEWRRVDITIVNATTGADIGPVTANGLYHLGDTYRNATLEERQITPYVMVDHKMGSLTLQGGLRHLTTRQNATRELVANTTNLSPTNPALRGAQFGTGAIVTRDNDARENAFAFGANYSFNRRFAVYAGYHRGVRTLGLTELSEDLHSGNTPPAIIGRPTSPTRIVRGYEAGVKYGTSKLGIFVTVFHEDIYNIQDTQVTINPQTGIIGATVIALQNQESRGVELESIWSPINGLSLGLNGVLQNPRWTDHNLKTQLLANGQLAVVDEHGKIPERTPKATAKAMAAYRFAKTQFGVFSVNTSYQYTGKRYADRANSEPTPLKAYGEFVVGAAFATNTGFAFRISVNNVFNHEGLSEGDPRSGNFIDPSLSYFNARPIQPRTVTGTVSYRF